MSDREMRATVCSTCGNTWGWHEENDPRHPFSTVNGPDALSIKDDNDHDGRVVPMTMPFDPALRMALMDAGVITTAMLDAADAKIKHLTKGVSDG